MTFSDRGELVSLWDIAPYHSSALAVTSDNEVLDFGRKDGDGEYPTIMRYSATRQTLGGILDSNLLDADGWFSVIDRTYGPPALRVVGKTVYICIPSDRMAFEFALDGTMIHSYRLGNFLERMKLSYNFGQVAAARFTFSASGKIFFELTGWAKMSKDSASPPIYDRLIVSLDPGNLTWSSWRIKGNDSTTRVFLGLNPDDSLVIHEILDSRHDVIVVQNDPVLFRASGSQPTP